MDTMQQVRDRYLEHLARFKAAGYDRAAAVRFVVDQLEHVRGPVLDVGSGQGVMASELARRGVGVVTIDVNAEEQRLGAVNAEYEGVADRIVFLPVDARTLPFPDGTFRTVDTLDAIHHLTDGPAVFSEMRRVLRPGGRVLLAELTAEGLALVGRMHEAEGRGVHPVGDVTIDAAIAWFESNGFRLAARREGHLHIVAVLEKPETGGRA